MLILTPQLLSGIELVLEEMLTPICYHIIGTYPGQSDCSHNPSRHSSTTFLIRNSKTKLLTVTFT